MTDAGAWSCSAKLSSVHQSPLHRLANGRLLKLKCSLRQEFVIGGFTDRSDGSPTVGSLLLGVYDEAGQLQATGSVGTSWNAATSSALRKQLAALETTTSPFDAANAPQRGRWNRRTLQSERFVKPVLVCEASFAEWTPDGLVRYASFKGMGTDRGTTTIRRERPVGTNQA